MVIWNWLKCRVWRRHEQKVLCGPDGLFLQCVRCGARSPGWVIDRKAVPSAPVARAVGHSTRAQTPAEPPRVIPFDRTSGARRLIKNAPAKRSRRTRRLAAEEEAALLAAARAIPRGVGPRLHALIVAALETGCLRSELLSLRWQHVDWERHELQIPASRSKTDTFRRVPLSARLAAVLQALKSEGERNPEACVFARGRRAAGGMTRAWDTAVLRSYGHEPEWRGTALSAASRAQLQAIDLQFRDLRYEASVRWLEAGWPRQHIRAMLGRPAGSETETYRNAARMGLHELMRRFDEARTKPRARMAKAEPRPSIDEQLPQWPMERH